MRKVIQAYSIPLVLFSVALVVLINLSFHSEATTNSKSTLSLDELQNTVGGLGITDFPFPVHFSTVLNDNYQIEFDIAHDTASYPTNLLVEVKYNNQKEGLIVVPTAYNSGSGLYEGTARERTSWPLGIYQANISLGFCD